MNRFYTPLLLATLLVSSLAPVSAKPAQKENNIWLPAPMTEVAEDVKTDPTHMWKSKGEIGTDGSSIYYKAITLKDNKGPKGKVELSQLVDGGNCGSPSTCAVRIRFTDEKGKSHLLQDYEQSCATPELYAINRSLTKLRACDQVMSLQPIR